jgi:hypothetical protein
MNGGGTIIQYFFKICFYIMGLVLFWCDGINFGAWSRNGPKTGIHVSVFGGGKFALGQKKSPFCVCTRFHLWYLVTK